MKLIVIPAFGTRISPRLDFAEYMHLVEIDKKIITSRDMIKIITQNRLDRIQQIINLKPDIIICDGLTEMCKNELEKSKIKVIPWTNGEIEEILSLFISGKLEKNKTQI